MGARQRVRLELHPAGGFRVETKCRRNWHNMQAQQTDSTNVAVGTTTKTFVGMPVVGEERAITLFCAWLRAEWTRHWQNRQQREVTERSAMEW